MASAIVTVKMTPGDLQIIDAALRLYPYTVSRLEIGKPLSIDEINAMSTIPMKTIARRACEVRSDLGLHGGNR